MTKKQINSTLRALTRARALMTGKGRWIKGEYYEKRTIDGKLVNCYCAMGALQKATRGKTQETRTAEACRVLAQVTPGIKKNLLDAYEDVEDAHRYSLAEAVVSWNDAKTRRVGHVLSAFDRAVHKLQTLAVRQGSSNR